MMKKIGIIVIYLVIASFLNPVQAPKTQAQGIQETKIGLGEVIFTQTDQPQQKGYGLWMNEISYTMVKIHLTISGKDPEAYNYQSETMATIKRLEELTKIDIIELLNISTDKKDALNRYLNDAQENLLKGDSISAYMKQEMNILKEDMQSCLTEKQISDKEYFDAIDRYDQNIMETSLNSSIMHENCVTEKRIQYNAKASIIQKLVFYLGLLQQKYDILFAKQDILTQNFEIFRDKILPDLNQIDELLKQYTF